MKILFKIPMLMAAVALSSGFKAVPENPPDASGLPRTVFVDGQRQHVQGIAYDKEKNCMYMSFTSRFLKVDMDGNILASIDRIQGHLGAVTFNPRNRKIYASLECKDDIIGQGIAKVLNVGTVSKADSRFYIAVIDVDKLDGIGMDPEKGDILKTSCIRKAVRDYADGHKYGCSGIDGVAIAPGIGSNADEMYLYVGYGIYGDVNRTDNDYQIIQRYKIKDIEKTSGPTIFGTAHENGPQKPDKEYFIFTGNTKYGIQNMAWDPYTGCMFLAVYKGSKETYPNYSLFAFEMNCKPFKAVLRNSTDKRKHLQVRLVEPKEGICPEKDADTGITGWKFKHGSTGLCPLGDGLWYISNKGKDKKTGTHSCRAKLYRWNGSADKPFVEE